MAIWSPGQGPFLMPVSFAIAVTGPQVVLNWPTAGKQSAGGTPSRLDPFAVGDTHVSMPVSFTFIDDSATDPIGRFGPPRNNVNAMPNGGNHAYCEVQLQQILLDPAGVPQLQPNGQVAYRVVASFTSHLFGPTAFWTPPPATGSVASANASVTQQQVIDGLLEPQWVDNIPVRIAYRCYLGDTRYFWLAGGPLLNLAGWDAQSNPEVVWTSNPQLPAFPGYSGPPMSYQTWLADCGWAYTDTFTVTLLPTSIWQANVLPAGIIYCPPGNASTEAFNFTTTLTAQTKVEQDKQTSYQVAQGLTKGASFQDTGGFDASFAASLIVGASLDLGETLAVGSEKTWDTTTTSTTTSTGSDSTTWIATATDTQVYTTSLVNAQSGDRGNWSTSPFWADLILLIVHPQFFQWDFANFHAMKMVAAQELYNAISIQELHDAVTNAVPTEPVTLVSVGGLQLLAQEAISLLALDPFYTSAWQGAALTGSRWCPMGSNLEFGTFVAPDSTVGQVKELDVTNTEASETDTSLTASMDYQSSVAQGFTLKSTTTGAEISKTGVGLKGTNGSFMLNLSDTATTSMISGSSLKSTQSVKVTYSSQTLDKLQQSTSVTAKLLDKSTTPPTPQGYISVNVYLDLVWGGIAVQDSAWPRRGLLWHTIRNPDGSWTALEGVNAAFSIPGAVAAVSATTDGVGGETQFLFTTLDGHLWHTGRRPDGSWTGLGDVNGQFSIPGPVTAVSAATDGVAGKPQFMWDSQFLFTTADGHLWHTIRNPDGSWTGLGDVNGQFSIPGPVAAVSATADGVAGETQFLFTTADGHLWHTIRHADGSWTGLEDVNSKFSIPAPVTAVSATADGMAGETQFLFTA